MMDVLVMYTGLPEVTVVPPSQSVEVTHSVKFTATVHGVGKENFTYQWRHNGVNIERETHNTLTIVNVTENHSGNYDCVVMSKLGDCVTSNTSELSKEFAYCIIVIRAQCGVYETYTPEGPGCITRVK